MSLKEDKLPLCVIVITYSFDEAFYNTICSILSQTVLPKEIVLVVKASGDIGSDVLRHAKDLFIDLKIIQERDSGIANAFNLGLAKAEAKFVNFLNAGDQYINKFALEIVRSNLVDGIPWFVYRRLDQRGNFVVAQKRFYSNASLFQFASGSVYLSHQATFYSADLIKDVGKYDEAHMMLGMDFDFNLRSWIKVAPVLYDIPLIVYDTTGVSSVKFFETLCVKLKIVAKSDLPLRVRAPAVLASSFKVCLGLCLRLLK